ncbi:MAG: hypothetical protein KAY50_00795 [Chitinophagaceae bacterium]|nr:hypothetical protein [Chitinophagaceae bacterium]
MKTPIITKIAKAVFSEIHKLDAGELQQVIDQCDSLTMTNCGWTEYASKDLIKYACKERLSFILPNQKEFPKTN